VLTLYYKATCPYSLRVRLILTEKLLPFSRRVISGEDSPAEVIDLSGGEVPALVDGSSAVCDSMVIAEYLEDAFAKPALRPFDARGRAVIRMAMRRVDAELMDTVLELAPAGRTPTDNGSSNHAAEVLQILSGWDHKMGDNGLLFGMEFSLADVWLFSAVEKARVLGWDLVPRFRKIERWYRRLSERASVRAERLAA
jgi:glutathione S-transferase